MHEYILVGPKSAKILTAAEPTNQPAASLCSIGLWGLSPHSLPRLQSIIEGGTKDYTYPLCFIHSTAPTAREEYSPMGLESKTNPAVPHHQSALIAHTYNQCRKFETDASRQSFNSAEFEYNLSLAAGVQLLLTGIIRRRLLHSLPLR